MNRGVRFFQEVDVKVVQIEFMFHRTGKHGPKIVDYFANQQRLRPFFYERNTHSVNLAASQENLTFGSLNMSDTNRAVQPQQIARGLRIE